MPFGNLLGAFSVLIGDLLWVPFKDFFCACWKPFGCLFGALGCLLGALGRLFGALGCLLDALGCLLGLLGCLLAPLGASWGDPGILGRIFDRFWLPKGCQNST